MAFQPLYMLDTNTSSYAINGSIPAVRERLRATLMSQVCVSAITQAELLFGLAKKHHIAKLKTAVHLFLLHVDILPWNGDAAQRYAGLRASLERNGTPLGSMDMLIAAHALASEAILVTNDQAFKQVEQISIVDWTQR